MGEAEGVVDEPSGFRTFWVASTVSAFGTYVTTVALQVLVVDDLGGSAIDVGLVNAARWVPYLLVGLLVGVLADRLRRRPVLVVTDLGRVVVLGGIPLLAALDRLTLPALLTLVMALGLLSLGNDAAHQSFLPRLVPRTGLSRANARLQQSDAAAQTSGSALGGVLVAVLGALLPHASNDTCGARWARAWGGCTGTGPWGHWRGARTSGSSSSACSARSTPRSC